MLFKGILGHDMFVDENGEVELNYTLLEKRGERKFQGSLYLHKEHKQRTYLHYYVPFTIGENSGSPCSHCVWNLQFNKSFDINERDYKRQRQCIQSHRSHLQVKGA